MQRYDTNNCIRVDDDPTWRTGPVCGFPDVKHCDTTGHVLDTKHSDTTYHIVDTEIRSNEMYEKLRSNDIRRCDFFEYHGPREALENTGRSIGDISKRDAKYFALSQDHSSTRNKTCHKKDARFIRVLKEFGKPKGVSENIHEKRSSNHPKREFHEQSVSKSSIKSAHGFDRSNNNRTRSSNHTKPDDSKSFVNLGGSERANDTGIFLNGPASRSSSLILIPNFSSDTPSRIKPSSTALSRTRSKSESHSAQYSKTLFSKNSDQKEKRWRVCVSCRTVTFYYDFKKNETWNDTCEICELPYFHNFLEHTAPNDRAFHHRRQK